MKKMDKIIGYAEIKRELMAIGDTLKNKEEYERLGVYAPRGLLLYGAPGVGKSMMAEALIEESGRRAYVIRKDKPGDEFINHITEIFKTAAENAPSILLMDDMDKYADEECRNAEEYVTVQSCIDEVRGKDVFILATVNDLDRLPCSLYRRGRIDRMIKVSAPRGEDALEIISHYLKTKRLAEDVCPRDIARIMDGRSCAEIEALINEAGLYAGYERHDGIMTRHVIEAMMKTVFSVPFRTFGEADGGVISDRAREVALHEAGHTVVSEVLMPDSINLVYAAGDGSEGFTSYYTGTDTSLTVKKHGIIGALGGMAAVEQRYGAPDIGNEKDLNRAFTLVRELVTENCTCGIALHRNRYEDSQKLWSAQEDTVAAEVEKYCRKAKEILAKNAELLDSVYTALCERRYLTSRDIREIRERCSITPVTL